MLNNTVLDTAIGLSFVFFLAALGCSALVEFVSNVTKKRAKFLLRGLRDLLDTPIDEQTTARPPTVPELWRDRGTEREAYGAMLTAGSVTPPGGQTSPDGAKTAVPGWTWAGKVMSHPMVLPFKQSRASAGPTRNPSYLPARTFAAALVAILVPNAKGQTTIYELRAAVRALDDDTAVFKPALLGLLTTAEGNLSTFMSSLEKWYDDAMDRISGSYKRWSKRWAIAFAVVFAVALQIDTIQIGTTLYAKEPLRQAVVAAATNNTLCAPGQTQQATADCVAQQLASLHESSGVPVGWSAELRPAAGDTGAWLLKALGWALTALAASFGAPFWFQALSKLGSLRNTGSRPAPSQ